MGSPPRELITPGILRHERNGVVPALVGWVVARVSVALGFALAHALSGTLGMPDGRLHLDQGLMTWDGTFYRVITTGWYSGAEVPREAVRFFPGYPGLARATEWLFLGNTDLALLFIANAAALAAALVLWHLTLHGTGDRSTADRAAWMLGVIPAANVMVFAYSESLMLLVASAVLLALLRDRPGWAATGGIAAGFLRPSGVLLAVPAAIEAWRWYSHRRAVRRDEAQQAQAQAQAQAQQGERAGARPSVGEYLGWGASVVAPVLGLLGALVVVSQRTGDVLTAYRIQRRLRDGFRDPLSRMVEAGIDFAGGHFHDVYNVAFALGFAALFVVAVRHRQRLSWLAFMAVTWVVAVGGNNMDSAGRYCVVVAPFTIALAQLAHSRRRQVVVAVFGVSATIWFTSEILLGRVIP